MPRRPKPTPATVALFVRHGVTATTGKVLPGRAKGLHLADSGRAQAEAVAERLATLKRVDAVYASPLERTRETAAAIGTRLGLKVGVEKGLLECDFGEWTGAELKALNRLEELGKIERIRRRSQEKGDEPTVYSLILVDPSRELEQRDLSAYPSGEIAELVAAYPELPFLTKPFTTERLYQALTPLLGAPGRVRGRRANDRVAYRDRTRQSS